MLAGGEGEEVSFFCLLLEERGGCGKKGGGNQMFEEK